MKGAGKTRKTALSTIDYDIQVKCKRVYCRPISSFESCARSEFQVVHILSTVEDTSMSYAKGIFRYRARRSYRKTSRRFRLNQEEAPAGSLTVAFHWRLPPSMPRRNKANHMFASLDNQTHEDRSLLVGRRRLHGNGSVAFLRCSSSRRYSCRTTMP